MFGENLHLRVDLLFIEIVYQKWLEIHDFQINLWIPRLIYAIIIFYVQFHARKYFIAIHIEVELVALSGMQIAVNYPQNYCWKDVIDRVELVRIDLFDVKLITLM